ncbi:concanavalin A-like lectin/glucanase superfamily protein [Anseongella ginsenosidimutans]|uniref:Concanavalin A-like lectin/glucanase superfamily protein n=1 Tax=Anseongella ginsenosidimutans TaxID=496056 RepID=A0A4V2UT61_9SPHI|nr:alkaline phosphatase family protein [Anseongella ginsenosidimutans]QEC54003.1 DUF4983 domain-containing protein [Anseongella ginsenosidimutans]TCS84289.1 concanavalin A-like lectin/glucanase superfamily protein [Anseongella ginsenosidimutans]
MKMIKKYAIKVSCGLAIGLTALMTACNGNFEKVLPDTDYSDSISVIYGNPKVLYLIVDGARGVSVRDAQAPHLTSLLPSSIYSWVSLSDDEINGDAGNWASLLTGVEKEKHGVVNNDLSSANLDEYPVIFERVKEALPESSISVFGTSALFTEQLSAGADVKETFDGDEGVTAAVIDALSEDDATFITAQFSGVDEAGAAHTYDLSSPEYKAAILAFDDQLGSILEALQNRPEYESENWLVVVTSSSGGPFTLPEEENDNTIFSKPAFNTFTVFYSRQYGQRFIGKPYLGSRFQGDFVRFQGQRKAQLLQGDNSVYDFAEDQEFTIELKVKKNPGPDNNYKFYYPAVLGKRSEWSSGWGGSPGWTIFLEDRFWMFNLRGDDGDVGQVRGADLADATWNSIAVSCVIRNGERFVRTYTNGAYNGEMNITGWGNIINDFPLTMGYLQGNGHREPDVYLSDVRIWRYPLPDEVISQFACETYIDASHPFYDYLAGYWPVYGGAEGDTLIRDEGPLGNHLRLSEDDFSWDLLNEFICAPSTADLGNLVPGTADIPAQLFSWLKIARQENWQLDGRVWLDQ